MMTISSAWMAVEWSGQSNLAKPCIVAVGLDLISKEFPIGCSRVGGLELLLSLF